MSSVAMVNSSSFFHFILFFSLIQLPILSYGGGFTADLIHRDSPLSPFKTTDFQSPSRPEAYGYIMLGSIGTPPTPFYGEIDTTRDFSWTQCLPCKQCYNQTVPFFDPTKSSTYNPVNGSSPICKEEDYIMLSSTDPTGCQYQVYYDDDSYSIGDVAVETFTFGSTSVPNLVFGCGHSQDRGYLPTSTGVLGLGGGNISFLNQQSGSFGGKFSYCFVRYDPNSKATGKISFGDDAVVSGPGVVSTPLVTSGNNSSLHMVTLESVKIGNKTIPYPNVTNAGNVVINTRYQLTFLPDPVNNIMWEVQQIIGGHWVPDPQGLYEVCYESATTRFDGPPIVFAFKGAELEVPLSTAFIERDGGVVCLSILPGDNDRPGVLGNALQVDFKVGYDLVGKTVSFKPTSCSQQ